MKKDILKKLERKVMGINYKYKKNRSVIDHYNSLKNAFYEYADKEQNYSFEKQFNQIITGSDLIGNYPNSNINPDCLYYFTDMNLVSEVNYSYLKNISIKAINDLKKRIVMIKDIREHRDNIVCKICFAAKNIKKTIDITLSKEVINSFRFNTSLTKRRYQALAIKNLAYCDFDKYIEE